MSQSVYGPIKSFKTATDLSAKQYFIVKLSAAQTVALASAATDILIGVLRNEPESGQAAEVHMINGGASAKVKAGGTISAGDMITSDSAGKAVATTTTGNYVLGMALEAAVDGDVFEFAPMNHARYAATA